MTTDTSRRTAFIAVDVQNDFCEGGNLAVAGGGRVAAGITRHLSRHRDDYALVTASLDWHDRDSDNCGHIALPPAEPDYIDTWPVHCIAGTLGAQTHAAFDTSSVDVLVRKGQGVPAYSAFEARTDGQHSLNTLLHDRQVTDLVIAGLATDYCVRATALSARQNGWPTTVLFDLTAAVHPENAAAVRDELIAAGCTVEGDVAG